MTRPDLTPDAASWDERYSATDQVWSGAPNSTLLSELTGLTPARALDVGCGEGADAVWLAEHGWQVTALDVSGVALARAADHARDAGVAIDFVHAGLVEADLAPGSFELVSAQYPVLLKTPATVAERVLIDLVAPGGTLLFVHHHAGTGHDHDRDHDHDRNHEGGFDRSLFAMPEDAVALLGDSWQVELDPQRPRSVSTGAGAGHTHDVVLRARRR